jgi:hypothetical protein
MKALLTLRRFLALTSAFMAVTLILAPRSFAVPAAPGVFSISQPDGTLINANARGDEHLNWMETTQGHTIAKGADGNWYYATTPASGIAADGPPASAVNGVDVGLLLTNVRADQPPLADLPKHLTPPRRPSTMMGPTMGDGQAIAPTPVGPHAGKLLIIMVDFTNKTGTYTAANFGSFFSSVATYYNTVSNGNVTLTAASETSISTH